MSVTVNSPIDATQPVPSVENSLALPSTKQLFRKGNARLIWLVATLFSLYQYFVQFSSGEIVDGLMQSFSLNAFGGGILASTYFYTYIIMQIPVGILIDRFGSRKLLSIGALIMFIGGLLFGMTHLLFLAVIGRMMMGVGGAFAFIGVLNLIAQWFPANRFGVLSAFVQAFGMMGSVFAGLFLAEYVEKTGWRSCIVEIAIVGFVVALLLWFFVRDAPVKKAAVSLLPKESAWSCLKQVMKNKVAWVNGIYSGLMYCIVTVVATMWGIPFIETAHHVSLIEAVFTCNMLIVGMALGGPCWCWLDSHLSQRKLLLAGCSLLGAVLLSILIYNPNLSLFFSAVLFFILGFVCSCFFITYVVAKEIATNAVRSTSLGFVNMLNMSGALIFQPLVGFILYVITKYTLTSGEPLLYTTSRYQIALSVIPIALLVAAFLAFFIPERTEVSTWKKSFMTDGSDCIT